MLDHTVDLFQFLRGLDTVLHTGYTKLYFHQKYRRVLFSPHSFPNLWFIDILIMAILTDVKWYLIIFLTCISLIISKLEHLFICLIVICMSSLLEKCLFSSSVHVSVDFFFLHLASYAVNFWYHSLVGYIFCTYFLTFCGLSFHLVYGFLCCLKTFEFNYIPSPPPHIL